MKKLVISFFIIVAFLGCKNTFLDDYKSALESPLIIEDTAANENADYFYKAEEEVDLEVLNSLDFPTKLNASKAEFADKISIQWKGVDKKSYDSVKYSLYRQTKNEDGEVSWIRLQEEIEELSYDDKADLKENVDYIYAVRAVYNLAEKKVASRLSYFSIGYIFSNIEVVSASYRDYTDRIEVSWYKQKGADSYEIYRASKDAPLTFTKCEGKIAKVDEKVDGVIKEKFVYSEYLHDYYKEHILVEGEDYSYKVIPKNNNMSPVAEPTVVFGSILATGAPPQTVVQTVSKGTNGSGIHITWENVVNVKYKIYRSKSPFGPFTQINTDEIETNSYFDNLEKVKEEDKNSVFYYKVSCVKNGIDGRLSEFDETLHSGYRYYILANDISVLKRKYPSQIIVLVNIKDPIEGEKIHLSYSKDNSTWTNVNTDGFDINQKKIVVNVENYNSSADYYFKARRVLTSATLPVFDETVLTGKSCLIQKTAEKGGPEIPFLLLSQGDHSIKNQIRVNGSWQDITNYGEHVDIELIRVYYWGKEVNVLKPFNINEKSKTVYTNNNIQGSEFSYTDNLLPDINPTEDTIAPMNAKILAGSSWNYWTWDREAWKYLNRKLPFDMKKSCGAYYKVKVKWKNATDWPESESTELTYGYPAITNDDFAHLGMWMREVCMNRLWHLAYVPYWGNISTTISVLTAVQTKRGEYSGEVGYTAAADGLGGSGKCWIKNYSDWGPEWNLYIDNESNGFNISLKYQSIGVFEMPLKIITPLYKGDIYAKLELMNGNFVDIPRGGFVEVTQKDQPKQKYENIGFYTSAMGITVAPNPNAASIIERYFPPKALEYRLNPGSDAGPSFELTQINFRENVEYWEGKISDDWTKYYGFKFE